MKHRFNYLTFILLLITAFCSCEREDPNDRSGEGTLTEATLTFRVPGSTLPQTRALEEENHDRLIKEVTVLEFRDNKYLHSRTGTILQSPSDESNEIKFKVTLATGTCDLVILANANQIISKCYSSGIPTGTSKTDIAAALEMKLGEDDDTTGESDKWNTDITADPPTYHIPMWGELEEAVIPETGETITFTKKYDLMRMVAKVDVTIKADILPATFTLTEVHFFNYQRKGLLIPDLARYNATPDKLPTLPATPVGLTGCERGQKWGNGDAALPGNKLTGEIFTFASPIGTEYTSRPCVVVGGKYKGSSKNTYYRIDLVDATGDYLPLLRNYKYDIVVTKVSGEGYVNVPTAYSSRPMNLKTEVIEWDESQMNDVVFDGVNFLSVSPGEIDIPQLGLTAADNYAITVATDVDIYKDEADQKDKNWTAKIYYDKEGTKETDDDGNQWLRLSQYYGDKIYSSTDASTKLRIKVLADASSESDQRTGWIHFKAGRLVYIVKVTQLDYTPAYVWITDLEGNSISTLTFSGENPEEKQFMVTWSPKSKPLQIERIPGGDPFNEGATSSMPQLPEGGNYIFNINPQPFSQSDLKENPFKSTSTMLQFAIGDGQGKVSNASINLRQMDYKIIPDGFKDGYVGYSVAAKIKSNVRWTMSIMDGADRLATSVKPPTAGTANVTGSSFNYQYINNSNKGEVIFRFSSPDGLFVDKDVIVELLPVSTLLAKSNIVYKEIDGKPALTFAETTERNIEIPANSQGVFFRWGSLVAISTPQQDDNSTAFNVNDDIVFRPPNNTTTIGSYGSVPYYDTYTFSGNYHTDAFVLANFPAEQPGRGYHSQNGIGDICRYISDKGWVEGHWRIPTQHEISQLFIIEETRNNNGIVGIPYGSFAIQKNTSKDGLALISSGVLGGSGIVYGQDGSGDGQDKKPDQEDKVFFPASGSFDDKGNMSRVGQYGFYHKSTFGTNLYGVEESSGLGSGWTSNGYVKNANPVRCIRDGVLNSQ